jgi:hypothetical protein
MKQSYTRKPHVDKGVAPASAPLYTTLYDLIATLQDSAESPEDVEVVTAEAIHMLNTHPVTCMGRFKGYRMVAEDELASGRERVSTFQLEKVVVSF